MPSSPPRAPTNLTAIDLYLLHLSFGLGILPQGVDKIGSRRRALRDVELGVVDVFVPAGNAISRRVGLKAVGQAVFHVAVVGCRPMRVRPVRRGAVVSRVLPLGAFGRHLVGTLAHMMRRHGVHSTAVPSVGVSDDSRFDGTQQVLPMPMKLGILPGGSTQTEPAVAQSNLSHKQRCKNKKVEVTPKVPRGF